MYASNSHSYTHLILALGSVREPTVWVFITSKYPGIHDIGRAKLIYSTVKRLRTCPGFYRRKQEHAFDPIDRGFIKISARKQNKIHTNGSDPPRLTHIEQRIGTVREPMDGYAVHSAVVPIIRTWVECDLAAPANQTRTERGG